MSNPFEGFLKNFQKFQEAMKGAQDELKSVRVTGEAGAGMVRVDMNGRYGVHHIELEDSLLSEKKVVIQDLIAGAVNDAVRKVEEINQTKMKSFLSGFGGLPSGFNFPFPPSEENK